MSNSFNLPLFRSDLRHFIMDSNKSLAEIGREIGINRMKMSRLFRQKHKMDIETFFALCKYMGQEPNKYML